MNYTLKSKILEACADALTERINCAIMETCLQYAAELREAAGDVVDVKERECGIALPDMQEYFKIADGVQQFGLVIEASTSDWPLDPTLIKDDIRLGYEQVMEKHQMEAEEHAAEMRRIEKAVAEACAILESHRRS